MAAAEFKTIEEPHAGRILSRANIVVGNLLTLMPAVLMIAGLGLGAGAVYLLDPGGPDAQPEDQIVAGILVVIGLAIAGVSAYLGLRNTTKIASHYLHRVARKEVRSRAERIVDPDDPEAIFVELVPRRNWSRMMLETATDIGYLVVDEDRREVLFEGDHERMRIPASTILSCEAEHTLIGEGAPGSMKYYFTVIEVEDGSASRELPFAFRGDLGQLGVSVRRERAIVLRNRIWDLMRE